MARASTTQTEAERRKRTKEVYEHAIRVVDFNSGHRQPPLASKLSVVGTLNRAGYGLEEIHRAFVAARGNEDLFQTTDDEGRTWIGINDRWKLREKIESNLSRVNDPRGEVIGLANDRVQKLRLQGESDE